MIDSHAHIYLPEFNDDRSEVIERCLESGVRNVLMPNVDHETIDDMLELEAEYPDFAISMMGLHPCSVKKDFERSLYEVEDWLSKREFLAVGEIGTDLYWDKTFWSEQKEAFKIQCELAKKYGLPVVIHCRETIDQTIELVRPFADSGLKGVFHCFTGDRNQANQILEMGFYLGIGGVSTFKNGGLDKVLPGINLDGLLLETDSPYLAPTPHRGKRNEPAYLELIRTKLAAILELEDEEVEQRTIENTRKLFNL